jgi:hypothetical protein
MAVSKEDDKAKAIWVFGLMTRFVRKLDARRANRAPPLERMKTTTTSIPYSGLAGRPSEVSRRAIAAFRQAVPAC